MKAMRLENYGGVDQFKWGDVPDPKAGAGEVVIAVKASGLNPVDLYLRQGMMRERVPLPLPAVLGVDVAGVVTAIGPGVGGFAVGDRVIGHLPINGKGAAAEQAVVPLAGLAKLPANLSFEQGATLPLVGLTGHDAVDALGGIRPGTRVLVSGALGGVGRAAVQYLKSLGAVPVAGVRAERLAEGRALAGEAIDIDAVPSVPSFDFAVSAAAPIAGKVPAFVRDGGTIGGAVGTPAEANPDGRIKVVTIWTKDDPRTLQAIADAAARGELDIPIGKTFPLRELAEAHTALAAHPAGKIILVH